MRCGAYEKRLKLIGFFLIMGMAALYAVYLTQLPSPEKLDEIAKNTKADYYYVEEISSTYERFLGYAIGDNDLSLIADMLDKDSDIYAEQVKYIEDCRAQGIRMEVPSGGLFADTKELGHNLYLVSSESDAVFTYSDKRVEKKEIRNWFIVYQHKKTVKIQYILPAG